MHSPIQRFDFFSLRDFALPPVPVPMPEPEEIKEKPETAAIVPPPPPPMFTLAQLEGEKKKARDEGYADGLGEGRKQAVDVDEQRRKHIAAVLDTLGTQIHLLEEDHRRYLSAKEGEVSRLALEVARQVAGEALMRMPEAPVEQMVRRCLPMLLAEPQLELIVHPEIVGAMQEKLAGLGENMRYEGKLSVVGDASLEAGDGKLRWRDGKASLMQSEIWQNIEAAMALPDILPQEHAPEMPPAPPPTQEI